MKILVAGGFDGGDDAARERVGAFAEALGAAIAEHGHVLLNGCRTEFDAMLAGAAQRQLSDSAGAERQIISYVLAGHSPIHGYGTLIRSRLADWDIGRETFYVPEQIQQADVVILVGGFAGTYRAANWARIAQKPLLPFTAFGGSAEKIYEQELNVFEQKYSAFVDALEFEQLNSLRPDWAAHAKDLVALAEKVGECRRAMVVMSYADRPELEDAYESVKFVVEEKLKYRCERVTEETAGSRILPAILEGIRRAAFTIVDLTDLRPNVFYELGFAEGLGKRVIVTAKHGTELPFDVKDMPTVFWNGQTQLRCDLEKRIASVVNGQVR